MPNYDYACLSCDEQQERNVSMECREDQFCEKCGNRLNRVWSFHGSVWAPTATGGHK